MLRFGRAVYTGLGAYIATAHALNAAASGVFASYLCH
jgi:ABC-type branched-subunit amino acid transport system permease subunit